MHQRGYILLARGKLTPVSGDGTQSPPGSGSTITLWDSSQNHNSSFGGPRFKRLIINIYSSHASGTNGLVIEESSDDGANWDQLTAYTINATTYTKNIVAVSAPMVRVRYTNSANVLTAWRMSVLGDVEERGNV